jgi:hypothetical protein
LQLLLCLCSFVLLLLLLLLLPLPPPLLLLLLPLPPLLLLLLLLRPLCVRHMYLVLCTTHSLQHRYTQPQQWRAHLLQPLSKHCICCLPPWNQASRRTCHAKGKDCHQLRASHCREGMGSNACGGGYHCW